MVDLLVNTMFDPPMGQLKLLLGIVGCVPRGCAAWTGGAWHESGGRPIRCVFSPAASVHTSDV